MTILPTLRASTLGILSLGEKTRARIISILDEARAELETPDAASAPAEKIAAFRTRLALMESVIAEEISADWYCVTADGVTRDADDVITALCGTDSDFAPIANSFSAKARSYKSVRTFNV